MPKCMNQTITVRGMSCEGCESAVEDALTAVSGVKSVEVDLEGESVTVDGTADTEELVTAIEDAGYDVPDASA